MPNPLKNPYPKWINTTQKEFSLAEKQKYVEKFDFPFCPDFSKYEKIDKIGQVTFGFVFLVSLFFTFKFIIGSN